MSGTATKTQLTLLTLPKQARFLRLDAAPGRRFSKDVLEAGRWVHPVTKERFHFSRQDLAELATNTNAWISLGNKVTFPVGPDCHFDDADDARSNLGFWSNFRVEGDRLWADVEVLDDAVLGKIGLTIQDVSAGIAPRALSAGGERLGPTIKHVAATPCPVMPGQENFVPLSRRDSMKDDQDDDADEAARDEEKRETGGDGALLAKIREKCGMAADASPEELLAAIPSKDADKKAAADAGAADEKEDEEEDSEEEAEDAREKVGFSRKELAEKVLALEAELGVVKKAHQDRELKLTQTSCDQLLVLARQNAAARGRPIPKDVEDDAKKLYLAGDRDMAIRTLERAVGDESFSGIRLANPGLREDEKEEKEKADTVSRILLSQGVKAEKNKKGKITGYSRTSAAVEEDTD